MRICILTLGSRGDVQPYVALARGLSAAGYDAALCAAPAFRSFVESHSVEWRSFDTGDPRAMIHSPEAKALVAGMANPVKMVRELVQLIEPLLEKGYTEACQSCSDADALLVAPTVLPLAQALQQKTGVPFAGAFLQPAPATANKSSQPKRADRRHSAPRNGSQPGSSGRIQLGNSRVACAGCRNAPAKGTPVFCCSACASGSTVGATSSASASLQL